MRRMLSLTLLALAAGARSASAAGLDSDLLAGFDARLIGPAGMSGRVAAVEAVPSRPEIVYAGAATGGVWKSDNGGLTWKPVFDEEAAHAIGSIAIFRGNPDIVWVGTGEGNVRNSASVGRGAWKSIDAGKTWSRVGLEKTERIYRLLAHPSDPDVAWACALGQEWGENPERGVFKTSDAGKSWQKVLYVDEKTGCGELAIDPSNPNHLIAGMWQFRRWPWFFKSGGPGSGMHVTWDGGSTWKKLQQEDGLPAGELGRMGIAFAPSNPEIVYAMVEAKKSALLRSVDNGKSWKSVNDKPNVVPRPFYFCDLRVDPAWPNRVYSLDYVIRVSNDSGKTFETLPGASWEQIHGDYHGMWINPHDPSHIYSANDGGVAVSRDRGQTFRFVGNLPLAQFYHVAVDMETPFNVYGGLQDNGSWRGPSAVWQAGGIRNYHWRTVGFGDGFDVVPMTDDPTRGYSLWQGGNLMRWDLATGETRVMKPAAPDGVKLRFNWNAGLATDPFDPNIVYLGSQFLHRSKDRGATWETISGDLTSNNTEWQKQDSSGGLTTDVTAAENFTTIIAIAPSALEQGLIWVGSDDGRLHVTRDGGATWTSVESKIAGVPKNTWIPHIRPSRHQAGEAFVVFDNHRRSDWKPYVYRTTDYGRTWTSLGGAGLDGYALAIDQDPVDPNLVFVGTEFGLHVSSDAGRSWTHLKKALPTASVMDLQIHPRDHDLVIGTHGRAVWILDDIGPFRSLSAETLKRPLHLYPIAPAQQYWERDEEGGFGFGAGEFRGESRPYGAILTYSLNLPGLPLQDEEKERERKEKERVEKRVAAEREEAERARAVQTPPEEKTAEEEKEKAEKEPKVEIEVADAAGKIVRKFKAPARLGVNRAVWNLRRDPGKEYPRSPDDPPVEEGRRTGPELPPGAYTVTVSYQDHKATQRMEIKPDPRSKNTAVDWQARESAVQRSLRLDDLMADAVWRIRRTRDDVAAVQERVKRAAKDAGEKDDEKLAELPLVKSGDEVKKKLDELEKKLWQSPEAIGILPDTDVQSWVGRGGFYIRTSFDPPTPTHFEHLRQGEAKLEGVLGEMNDVFAKDVAAFAAEAQKAGVGLLPVGEPLRIGGR